MPNKSKNRGGFSLVEVLVFTALIGIILTTAVSASVLAIRKFKYVQLKTMGTYYSVYLENWLEAEKEKNWNEFKEKAGNTYCFNQDTIISWPSPGTCTGTFGNPPIFQREVTLTQITENNKVVIKAEITTKWSRANNQEEKTTIIRKFYK